ncbi:hypothetical protein SAMD00023353_4300540 [Rosellinia necatrix]|uniref:Uncharacterized protein n=1 Tax=Rosellinia necatrix TaxID=77044 RepID=A0A1W2TNR2_ROSNE|nr:hypothetical protein SAMD00023353_4300540 [Rosellinia necatrix]
MYIFYGKLNWPKYAHAEPFVLLFPGELGYYDPVCAYWQWTVDKNNKKKTNTWHEDSIKRIFRENDGRLNIGFDFDNYYFFDVTIDEMARVAQLTIRNEKGSKSEVQTLRQVYQDENKIPKCAVYMGKFNNYYAQDEMLTVLVPDGLEVGRTICAFFQWTMDSKAVMNSNNKIVTPFLQVSSNTTDGSRAFTFRSEDNYYTWDGSIDRNESALSVTMYDTKGYPGNQGDGPFRLARVGWSAPGRRKALIVRYGVGTKDRAIFDVRDLLVKSMGWNPAAIEMLYYNDEPPRQSATLLDNQEAPTVARFKAKFSSLISSANRGDVRFLYVDSHGVPRDNPQSGESDKVDEGWVLAKTDDGRLKEEVWDDWISDELRNLPPTTNFTILTSSCLGGGMLDIHRGARGVLLAGVHESQTNVKVPYFRGQDPWTYSVVRIITGRSKKKRPMPTYTGLYKEAKKYIRDQRDQDAFERKAYLGPSPDELKPLPANIAARTSHQDPQMIFIDRYMDVDKERFLYPISEWKTAAVIANPGPQKRFPKDEF